MKESVLITGGARRLGRAIAVACAREGANVGITYRTSADEAWELVAQLYREFPEQKFAAFEADVSRFVDLEKVAEQAGGGLGPVTGLVNNAAIFRRTPFAEMTEADFDDHIAANLKGPYLASKIFGDIFLAQGRGSILNIADIHGLRPLKNYIPYCVSKAGVVMLTEALAKALAPTVRVNCICPGTILPPSEAQGPGAYESAEERHVEDLAGGDHQDGQDDSAAAPTLQDEERISQADTHGAKGNDWQLCAVAQRAHDWHFDQHNERRIDDQQAADRGFIEVEHAREVPTQGLEVLEECGGAQHRQQQQPEEACVAPWRWWPRVRCCGAPVHSFLVMATDVQRHEFP